jgi:PST family polysaccharide transporter
MADIDTRAKRGMALLALRQILLQTVSMLVGIYISRKLGPEGQGIANLTLFVVSALGFFGDFGILASFIQRREAATEKQMQVGITLQQLLVLGVTVVLLTTAPLWHRLFRGMPPESTLWIRLLAFNLLFASWRALGVMQLERNLSYTKVAIIEVAEGLTLQAVSVWLVWIGKGPVALVWAAIARGAIGAALAWRLAPWTLRWHFDRRVAREILRFGLVFQSQAIVNQLGAWLTPVLMGAMFGPREVGYLTWASANGKKPMMLLESVTRVAFPYFSRLQDDFPKVLHALERYLNWLLLAGCFWSVLLWSAGMPLVRVIYGHAWAPAVLALQLFSLCLLFDIIASVGWVALNGIGNAAYPARLLVVQTAARIALTLALLPLGRLAVPIGYLAVQILSAFWMIRGLGTGVVQRVLTPLTWLIGPSLGATVIGLLAQQVPGPEWGRAVSATFASGAAFLALSWLLSPRWMREQALSLVQRRRGAV